MATTVIMGPCLLKWNSVVFWSAGAVTVEQVRTTFDITTDAHGIVDSRHKNALIRVSFTPSGRLEELAALLTWFSAKIPGQSLVPAGTGNEKSLVIQPLHNAGGASRIWTFLRAGPTAMGALNISASKTMMGEVTLTCLVSTVTADTFYTTATYAAPGAGDVDDFDPTRIVTLPCEAVWADDPDELVSGDLVMTSEDGWTIDLGIRSKEHEREAMGMADITFTDMAPSLTGNVANAFDHTGALLAEQTWATQMPFATARPGQTATRKRLGLRALHADSTAGTVEIATGQELLYLPRAEMTTQQLAWAAEVNRTRGVTFKSIPKFTAGVRTAMVVKAEEA